jgi:hypothetical protein
MVHEVVGDEVDLTTVWLQRNNLAKKATNSSVIFWAAVLTLNLPLVC